MGWGAGLAIQVRCLIEQTGGQLVAAVVGDIIEDVVLVVESGAATNRSLAVAPRVPGEAKLWCEVKVRLSNPVAVTCSPLVEQVAGAGNQSCGGAGDGRQIAVGASGIAKVAQSVVQGEVGANLPGVANVGLKARIEKTAGRIAESGQFGAESLAVAEVASGKRVVRNIGVAPAEGDAGRVYEVAGVVRRGLKACSRVGARRQQVKVDVGIQERGEAVEGGK